MERLHHIALLFALSMASVFHIQAQKPAITCAAGYHTPGMTATITCHFHGQISTDQNTGVYITRYKLGAPKDDSGKEVLMCHFSGGSVSVCNPEPGYRFINFNKNNLTIEVPDVSPEFAGRYSCGVVPADSRAVIPCLLVVKDTLETEVPYKHNQNDLGASERHKDLHTRVQTTHNVTIVILVAIIMLVALGTVIYALVAHKKNWLPFSLCRTQGDVENTGQLPEPDRSGKLSVAYKPVGQATREDDHPYKNDPAPPQETPSNPTNERQPMLPASHNQSDNIGIEEKTDEKKIETKEERKARYEKEDKERKAELKKRMESATKEQKKSIKEEFDKKEKEVKNQRKTEEERLKQEEKAEKERSKQNKKEQEKLAKGKK